MGDNFLDNYSPFDNPEPIPPVRSSVPITGDNDIDDDEIREYEKRLDMLENRINSQEIQLAVAQESGTVEPPPNWPKFYPLVHFEIDEVPPGLQHFVHESMFAWCIMFVAFAINWLASLSLLQAGDVTSISSPGSKIALSTLYLFVITPLSLDIVALGVYRVLKREPSTFAYIKVFTILGVITIFEACLTLGLESSGGCGVVTTLYIIFSKHWFISILCILASTGLAAAAFSHGKLLHGLWKYYRGTEQGTNMEVDVKKSLAVMVVEALNKTNTNQV